MIHSCPCCSEKLIRCIGKKGTYWYCLRCREEMPDLEDVIAIQKKRRELSALSILTSEPKITEPKITTAMR